MRKRIRVAALAVFMAIACVFFGACRDMGLSAYEVAVANGFAGSESEWLESLRGADGRDVSIYDLYAEYLEDNPESSFTDFLNSYLTLDYYPETAATGKAIASAVSVWCTFETRKSGLPGGTRTQSHSAGAGVILAIEEQTAYIITNYHVVYDGDSLTADKISDDISVYTYGRESESNAIAAEFIGGSMTNDIAVLRAESAYFADSMITPAAIADSNTVVAGQRAIAIGNPEALGISATSGIVSVDSEYIDMTAIDNSAEKNTFRVMRIDTAVNSGNSGGGLFDIEGRLIGIVNAKTSDTDVENIAYAIPANIAVGIARQVIAGVSKKCLLGITTTASASHMVYDSASGGVRLVEIITVTKVTAGAAADGIFQAGDVLQSVTLNDSDYYELTRSFHLADYLYKANTGDTLKITVKRINTTTELVIVIKDSDMKSF